MQPEKSQTGPSWSHILHGPGTPVSNIRKTTAPTQGRGGPVPWLQQAPLAWGEGEPGDSPPFCGVSITRLGTQTQAEPSKSLFLQVLRPQPPLPIIYPGVLRRAVGGGIWEGWFLLETGKVE
jgi:hypothetical protein